MRGLRNNQILRLRLRMTLKKNTPVAMPEFPLYSGLQAENLPELARELVKMKVDFLRHGLQF